MCNPDGLAANYKTFSEALTEFAPRVCKEASVLLSSASDYDIETTITSTDGLSQTFSCFKGSKSIVYFSSSFQTVVRWRTIPPLSLIESFWRWIREPSGRSLMSFLREMIGAIAFCFLLPYLYEGIPWINETIDWIKVPNSLISMSFWECLVLMLSFVWILETVQFVVYASNCLIVYSRFTIVRQCNNLRSLSIRSQKNGHGTVRVMPATQRCDSFKSESHSDKDSHEIIPQTYGEEMATRLVNLYTRAVGSFWTVMSYSKAIFITFMNRALVDSLDFQKFEQASSIEKRTNPDGSVVEEIFENERLQPFRVESVLFFLFDRILGMGSSMAGTFLTNG